MRTAIHRDLDPVFGSAHPHCETPITDHAARDVLSELPIAVVSLQMYMVAALYPRVPCRIALELQHQPRRIHTHPAPECTLKGDSARMRAAGVDTGPQQAVGLRVVLHQGRRNVLVIVGAVTQLAPVVAAKAEETEGGCDGTPASAYRVLDGRAGVGYPSDQNESNTAKNPRVLVADSHRVPRHSPINRGGQLFKHVCAIAKLPIVVGPLMWR